MKRTTTWAFVSRVRPPMCRSRQVHGPAGCAAGAQMPNLRAAQGVQTKSVLGLAGGGFDVASRGRRHLFSAALRRVLVPLLVAQPLQITQAESPAMTYRQATDLAKQSRPGSADSKPTEPDRQGTAAPGRLAAPGNFQFTPVEPAQSPGVEPHKDAGTTGQVTPNGAVAACRANGEEFTPAMVVIRPGRFTMGSPADEPGRSAAEGPRHRVTISRPFALGQCEVTVGQFRRFVRETDYRTVAEQSDSDGCYAWDAEQVKWVQKKTANWRNPGYPQTEDHPVVCIAQADAEAYLDWLSRRTGARYRLPSEAEWEYAARADTRTAYWWGGEIGYNRANCDGCGSAWDAKGTAAAGSFAANPFGLFDTAGNAWEWTADCWHGNYQDAPRDGSAWLDANQGDCAGRVVRGGSWNVNPQFLRSALRLRGRTVVAAIDYLGFRIARDL